MKGSFRLVDLTVIDLSLDWIREADAIEDGEIEGTSGCSGPMR
ncbi:MAG TPA: hypothetical protein VLC46_28350 [Thermoanaerobaculia bacterium]|jgi:hypothetical protein|nr:hypothetical protein [Thermoanaerobaculia bacterium]